MKQIQDWLAAHSISAKTVTTAWLFCLSAFYASKDFHDYVLNVYFALPKGIHALLSGVVVPLLIFWRTTHTTKVTAEVEDGVPAVASASASATISEK